MSGKNSSTSNFLLGAILGAAAGAALGILFAPAPGEENRRRLKKKLKELKVKANDAAKDFEPLVKKAKEAVEPLVRDIENSEVGRIAKEAMEPLAKDISDFEVVEKVRDAVEPMKENVGDLTVVRKAQELFDDVKPQKKKFFRR